MEIHPYVPPTLPQNLTSSQVLLPSGKEEEEDNYSDFDSEGGKKPRTTVYKPAPTPLSPVHSAKTSPQASEVLPSEHATPKASPQASEVLPENLSSTHKSKKDHTSSSAHESSDLFPKARSSSYSSSGSGHGQEISPEVLPLVPETNQEQQNIP